MTGRTIAKKYQIIETLREQRFYDVYAARVMNTETRSIVKVAHPEYSTPGRTLDALRSSLAGVESLKYPGIAQLRDFGEDGELYFAEEYYEGTLLRDILDTGSSLNSLQTLELGIKIVESLAHAHGKGVTHGLLSPESVVVLSNLTVKIADFQYLAAITSGMNICNGHDRGRDAVYCAPELVTGLTPSMQSDIFAAGVMLYELMTGSLPYSSRQAVEMALDKDHFSPVPPQDLNPRVPPLLNSVILKAIKPKPASRYESASELLSELLLCRSSMIRAMGSEKPGDSEHDAPITGRKGREPQPRARAADYSEQNTQARGENSQPLTASSILEEVDVDNKKFKTRLAIAIASGMAFLALLITVIALFLRSPLFNPGATSGQPMPNLVGTDATQAKSLLGAKGYQIDVIEEFSDEVSKSLIIRQDPLAGAQIKAGGQVTLYVSKGAEQKGIPDFTKKSSKDAESLARELGFKLGEIVYEFSEEVAKDFVMDQRPPPGEQRDSGSIIKLIISKGPEPNYVQMPSLAGLSIDEARSVLSSNGITLGEIKSDPTTAPPADGVARVLDQSVLPGSKVNTKDMSPVDITISGSTGENPAPEEELFGNDTTTPPADQAKAQKINIAITGDGDSEVVVRVKDKNYTTPHEIYRQTHKKGDKVSVTAKGSGRVQVQVFINGSIEKELEF